MQHDRITPSLDVERQITLKAALFWGSVALGIVLGICALATLCGALLSAQQPATNPVPASPARPAATYRTHDGALLNDLTVTPGAINGLTAAQLCDPGFRTATVRHVTQATKLRACAEYGIARADCTGERYEIDHLISLELGGSNELSNLWPEPYEPKPGAREKDVVEDWLHRQVCSGAMTLPQAQLAISTDWYDVFLQINAPMAQTGAGR